MSRSKDDIAKNEVNINKHLGLNNWTMAIDGFMDPYITCCFISETRVFINLFYNPTLTHYHLFWDIKDKKMIGDFHKETLQCTIKNFPYKCFYNDEEDCVHSFYRQGEFFDVPVQNP